MADYKDYIVRYDIQASVQNAAIGLKELRSIVTQLEAPMTSISKAISQVSSSLTQLKHNSQLTFTPTINTIEFDAQLKKMVAAVRTAASEMHAALYGALSGNPNATSAIKKGAAKALSGPTTITQIDKEIANLQKQYDKLLGTPKKNRKGTTVRAKDGDIFYAQQANMLDRVAKLKGQAKSIKERISQLKADRAILEKAEKEATASASRSASAVKKTVAKAQATPVTNVTPAVIREWGKVFGNSKLKNLTVNIRGNASGPKGALTVIEQVMTSLKALQSQGTFTINPVLHTENFAAAEAQLRSLARLSGKIATPFGGQSGKKGAAKGANAKPFAVDLIGNITSIAPPKTELVVPVVGEMTKLQNKVTEAIPVNAKISSGSITESIKGMKNRPTLPMAVKLMWENGAIGKNKQLKDFQSKILLSNLSLIQVTRLPN